MSASRPAKQALVLGAGISGLAAARALRRDGFAVTVVEAADQVGGCLRTVEHQGYTIEVGANTVRRGPELLSLASDAGCEADLQPPSERAHHRYLVRHGRLEVLPAGPRELLTTPLLTWAGRLRLLGELFLTEPQPPDPDQPLAAFVTRRFGPEALPLAEAMAHGVYAGDARELAVGHAFPSVWRLIERHGGILSGLLAERKRSQGKPATVPPGTLRPTRSPGEPGLTGFRGGFGHLAQRLAAGLDLRLGQRVVALGRLPAAPGARPAFTVSLAGAEGRATLPPVERLVVALPAEATAGLLAPLGDTTPIAALPHAPVAVVALGYPLQRIAHPLDGFGFLAPGSESREILGCVFTSSLFPDRAPDDRALLTVMVGGRRRPELVELADRDLVKLAHAELGELLGAGGEPEMAYVTRWRPGIPQPTTAWAEAGRCADRLERENPGLTLLGAWRHGVGVPDCARAGWTLAGSEEEA